MSKKDNPQRAFYDRMRRAVGTEALEKMQNSKVLIVGMSGLGVEIAKNLILSGISTVYLMDDGPVEWSDLSTNFYASEKDVGKNRCETVINHLRRLNAFVMVERVTGSLSEEILNKMKLNLCLFTNSNICSLIKENEICRKTKTKFIACEIRGLFGCLFNDLGEEFEVYDLTGEPPVENNIVDIEKGNPTRIVCLQEEGTFGHRLKEDDEVVFSYVGGLTHLNELKEPVKVILGEGTGRYSFFVDLDTSSCTDEYETQTGFVKQVKKSKVISHKSLSDNLDESFTPQIAIYDLGKFDWGQTRIFPLFLTLHRYMEQNEGRLPRSYHKEDSDQFLSLLPENFPDLTFARAFSYGARGRVNPLACLIGGMASHEVLKVISGKTNPLTQWFCVDALEALPDNWEENITHEQSSPLGCRYDGQIMTFGKKFCDEIALKRIFLIGVGALGCEYMKNFAMMGIGRKNEDQKQEEKEEETEGEEQEEEEKEKKKKKRKKKKKKEGKITVTDMDAIEVSNLNRQFLFREEHIGKMKSHSASKVVLSLMNPSLNLSSLTEKVGPGQSEARVFHDLFWRKVDIAVCALDNLKARKYVDLQCSYYQKPMIDAGTEGTKGNTSCIIPKLTETYRSQADPTIQTHPHCTVANFPYKPIHCIVWSKMKFKEMFLETPQEVNRYLKSGKKIYCSSERLQQMNMITKLKVLSQIHESLVTDKPSNFDDCIRFSRLFFQRYYHDEILQLLYSFPYDHRDPESGLLFWSEDKRPPIPQIFEFKNKNHIGYIEACANLRANMFRLEGKSVEEYEEGYRKVLEEMTIPQFVPKKKLLFDDGTPQSPDASKTHLGALLSLEEMQEDIEMCLATIPSSLDSELTEKKLKSMTYDKDDDENYHTAFLTYASNCRSLNYRIPILSFFDIKGIAGKIIPALVTTTASITGFGMIEILKALQGKNKIESYRNAYLNLALQECYCTQSEPPPPKKTGYKDSTDWDIIEIRKRRDISLQEFLDIFVKSYKLQCAFFMVGEKILYSDKDSKISEKDLKTPLSKFIFRKLKKKPSKGKMFIRIEGSYTKSGVFIEKKFPSIKYQFRGF